MLEAIGRVVAVDGSWAIITTQPHKNCEHCSNGGGCGTALTLGMLQPSQVQLRLFNPIGASPGDLVIIGVTEGSFLRATALLYGLPLLTLIVGAMTSQWLGLYWIPGYVELMSLLGGVLGLLAGLGWIWYLTVHNDPNTICQTTILRYSVELSVLPYPHT